MKKIVLFLSLLTLSLFVIIGCGPRLTDDDSNALAGQAVAINKNIRKGDVFILPYTQNQNLRSSVGEILEYQSADNIQKRNPVIKFKIWSSGETQEVALDPHGRQVWLPFGGQRFLITLTNPQKDNSPIQIDFDGDGVSDVNHKGVSLHFKDGSTVVNGGDWCAQQ